MNTFASLDVKAAFYIVLRELLLPLDTTYEQLQILLEDLEIPSLFQQPLSAMLQQPGIIPSIVDDKHLIANLSET